MNRFFGKVLKKWGGSHDPNLFPSSSTIYTWTPLPYSPYITSKDKAKTYLAGRE